LNPRTIQNPFSKLIGFPKLLIFEMVEMIQVEYPKMYIRIYERRKLESKIRSKNVYMLIKGEYYVPSIANSE
jgi:hypothetical protein